MVRRLPIAMAFIASIDVITSVAHAQTAADLPPPTNALATASGVTRHQPYWTGNGPTRGFLSTTFDVGAMYARPTMAVGYGKPHYRWFGLEAGSGFSLTGSRLYGGVRGVWTGIDFRIGARYEAPVEQNFLPPQRQYVREDLETEIPPQSRYVALESELTTSWPMPGGSMFGVLSGYYITAVPEPYFVFEHSLKTVVAPPWVWRARLGYMVHLGWLESMRFGAAAEVMHVPLRDDTVVVRAGPVLNVALTHHLDAVGAIMLIAASPDSLGVVGADIGQLGVRYRWATGDRWAEFP